MEIAEIVQAVRELSAEQRRELIKQLSDLENDDSLAKKRSILDYRGIGEHLRDIDAQEYVNKLRSEWDDRP